MLISLGNRMIRDAPRQIALPHATVTRSLWQLADEIELERAMRASEELAVEQASRVAAMRRI
jgi:hypothetical protein